MRFLSSSFVVAVVMAVSLWSGAARAQTTGPTVTGINGVVTRVEPDGSDASIKHPHPDGVLANAINFADCEADLRLRVSLGISAINSSYNLQAWVGTSDCTQLAARQTSTASCWRVSPGDSIAQRQPTQIDIRVQDILSQLNSSATKDPTRYIAGDEKACHNQTTSGATALSIYFFFVDGAFNATGGQTYGVSVDTVAGTVGTIKPAIGSNILYVDVPSTLDPDTKGFNVYCDPPTDPKADVAVTATDTTPATCDASSAAALVAADAADEAGADAGDVGDAATPDAGATDAGTADATTSADASCPTTVTPANNGDCKTSTVLVSGGGTTSVDEAGTSTVTGGVQKIIPGAYLCKQVDNTTTHIQIEGVGNGTHYNIAVAARDAVGNVGPLSNVVCATPGPIDDFWDDYSGAGGGAGGSCALEGAGMPAGTGALALGMLATAIASARRRRRS